LDDTNIRTISLDYLHRQVSFVFQRFGRYEATAADNIAYGDWQNLLGDQRHRSVEKIAKLADARIT
jgi:ATP-binding cassette subfamily B protein